MTAIRFFMSTAPSVEPYFRLDDKGPWYDLYGNQYEADEEMGGPEGMSGWVQEGAPHLFDAVVRSLFGALCTEDKRAR